MEIDLMTIREAHEHFGLPIKTIENHYRLKNIDGLKVDGRVYVVARSVEKWIDENMKPMTFEDMFYTAEEALTMISDILNRTRKGE